MVFRLSKLSLFEHPFLGNLVLNFSNQTINETAVAPFTTLIIGPNGTGKSQILRAIADIFREISQEMNNKRQKRLIYGYNLEFVVDGVTYCVDNRFLFDSDLDSVNTKIREHNNTYPYWPHIEEINNPKEFFSFRLRENDSEYTRFEPKELAHTIKNTNGRIYILSCVGARTHLVFVNGQRAQLSNIKLPIKILAASFMLNDKFLFSKEAGKEKSDIYHYLGIRSTRGSASTRTYIRRVVENIIAASDDVIFLQNLNEMLHFLEFKKSFRILLNLRFKKIFFNNKVNEGTFRSFFEDWKTSRPRRKTMPFSVNYFKTLSKNEVEELVDFVNGTVGPRISMVGHASYYDYDLLDHKNIDAKKSKNEFELIKKLMKLDLVSYPQIMLKKEKAFDLEESSSGEYHLIATLTSIMANISNKSLILIDEPEISFHPNWQMNYITIMKKIFKNHADCHFVIATHSHFMVSDLQKESSSIVVLNRNHLNKILSKTYGENTFGWTAEDILYNVFDVPTVRNYYLAEKVGKILDMIGEREQNVEKIKKAVSELKEIHLNLKDIDPMKEIITKLIERYG